MITQEAKGPAEVEACPCCGGTSGVTVITDTSPEVQAWRCAACGTDWAVTVVNPHPRRRLHQLTVDVTARAVVLEVSALAERADTLTEGQLRARLIGCLARLHAVLPAWHRSNNEVPSAQPVPTSATVTAVDSGGTATARSAGRPGHPATRRECLR